MTGELSIIPTETLKQMIIEAVRESLKNNLPDKENSKNQEEYLTRKEAYKFLRIGSTKFNELRSLGIVKPTRIGRKTIYKKSHLLEINNPLNTTK